MDLLMKSSKKTSFLNKEFKHRDVHEDVGDHSQ
jgi:hypothetical protein